MYGRGGRPGQGILLLVRRNHQSLHWPLFFINFGIFWKIPITGGCRLRKRLSRRPPPRSGRRGTFFARRAYCVGTSYKSMCVCSSVRASVRPSGLFLITFLIAKTHESKGFGPETGSETGPKVTKCVRT